jgi:hypothetical protein
MVRSGRRFSRQARNTLAYRTCVWYNGGVEERHREPDSSELMAEIARTCGVLNATTGRLVSLVARVLESDTWQVAGIHSPSQWVAWQCGVSPARARSLVAMARRRAELPATSAAHEAGECARTRWR